MQYSGELVVEPYNEILLSVEHAEKKTVDGFLAFWAYHVTGFDDTKHCMPCFLGEREWKVKGAMPTIPVDAPVSIPMKGNYFYICGVTDFKIFTHEEYMRNNFHMPLRWEQGSTVTMTTYNGFTVTVANVARVEFDDKVVMRLYKDKGEEFYTCRNFQFAAQMYVKQ